MASAAVGGEGSGLGYDVAVAVMPISSVEGQPDTPERSGGHLPGHDDAIGRPWGQRSTMLLEQGEQAVRAATEALARQIAVTAQLMAAVIEEQQVVSSAPAMFGLESVQVSFGVTLSAGVQALFTAQAGSSAQVAITLSRRADGGSGH